MGRRVVNATPHRGEKTDVSEYSLGDRIGKGAFATVYKAIDVKTAVVVAIKQIPLEKIRSVDSIMGEIELLQGLQHPNIVKYLGFAKSETYLNIVLEYCENGSLTAILRKFGSFPESLISRYTRQVLEGLDYLHSQGTIHRDIKGANILTTKDGVAKLADFGVATRMVPGSGPVERPGVVGTPHWMAPEIIQMQEPSTACDIWSLGATIVELYTGQPPYGNRSDIAAMYAIVQQESTALIPETGSHGLRDFLTLCFEKDPALRVNARDLLAHGWIGKFNATNERAGLASPEKAVQEWNSPSRRKRLAVRSMLDLNQSKRRGSKNFSDSSDIEQDFVTLNVFDRPPDVELAPVRAPLSGFVESNTDTYDSVYEGDFEVELVAKKPPSLRLSDSSHSTDSSNASPPTPHAHSVEPDPFTGLGDLQDADLDEELMRAQTEAKNLISLLSSNKTDLRVGYLRLVELVTSKPVLRRDIAQSRLLAKSLKFLGNVRNETVLAFLALVDLCTPSGSHTVVTSFCISGGLSFLLQQTGHAAPIVLRLLHKMTSVQEGRGADEDGMGIARQLAFREDAIALLCAFFSPETKGLNLLLASSVIIRVFESCGPRYRSDLWYHFNAYSFFRLLVDWLHVPFVLENNAENQLCTNIYKLIASFARTPQEQLVEQVDQRILRRLMRAYIRLPLGSPHRTTLLEFYKTVSTLAPVLDAMHKGNVAPHLIAALRRSLHDPDVSTREAQVTANCLVPALFNYARIDRARQREVARYDLLNVLHDCAREFPALQEFVYQIFTALAHANHDQCWDALWKAQGLQLLFKLAIEPGWQAMAISSIDIWTQAQPELVSELLAAHSSVIITALSTTQNSVYDGVLSAVANLIDQNRFLCRNLDLEALFKIFKKNLAPSNTYGSAPSLVLSLQIILWVINGNSSDPYTRANTLSLAKATHLLGVINKIGRDAATPVPAKKLISQIVEISEVSH